MNRRARKFVTILGAKIPFENIRSTPLNDIVGGWVSYRFRFTVLPPPPRFECITNIVVPDEHS